MEAVRHTTLDKLCESIGDALETENEARVDAEAGKQAALAYMGQHKVSVYKHAGIELIFVPGHDKLRVRPVKGEGDVQVNSLPADAGDDEGDAAQE